MGVALGCALTTKSIGVVFVALPLLAAWRLRRDRRRALECVLIAAVASAVVVVAVWEIHFTLARHVNPALMEQGYYQTPSASARAFLEGPGASPSWRCRRSWPRRSDIRAMVRLGASGDRFLQARSDGEPVLDVADRRARRRVLVGFGRQRALVSAICICR